ncbi:hypothetical protein HAX54_013926 [Datura stramonium]|uniref:Uncharacterized protein n=1 Tax=Datura stramonium TaxID=4076 RepID=A0ABS8TM54_DATST|nr:hypothetical protein [Datura stramonium]
MKQQIHEYGWTNQFVAILDEDLYDTPLVGSWGTHLDIAYACLWSHISNPIICKSFDKSRAPTFSSTRIDSPIYSSIPSASEVLYYQDNASLPPHVIPIEGWPSPTYIPIAHTPRFSVELTNPFVFANTFPALVRDPVQCKEVNLSITEEINFMSLPASLSNYIKHLISAKNHNRIAGVPFE